MAKKSYLNINGIEVAVSNLDKVLYPEANFTKGDVIDYYVRISSVLLPHLKNRAVSLKRYPDGVAGFFFYEKQKPAHSPDWIKTTQVPRSDESIIDYCMLGDLPSLVWAANMANLELHTFLHRASSPKRPAVLAFDLDPGTPANIIECCQVGLMVRDLFDAMGLQSFPKTSGSKGLQVYVPLNTAVTYEKTKAFSHALAQFLERQFPKLIVSKMQKSLRTGKILVDWSQNDDHKTTVNVYSLRAKEQPTVSTCVTWDEVEAAAALGKTKSRGKGSPSKLPLVFTCTDVFKRVEKFGDLFAPVLTLKQKLPALESLTWHEEGTAKA